jgi:hypothetical protein
LNQTVATAVAATAVPLLYHAVQNAMLELLHCKSLQMSREYILVMIGVNFLLTRPLRVLSWSTSGTVIAVDAHVMHHQNVKHMDHHVHLATTTHN